MSEAETLAKHIFDVLKATQAHELSLYNVLVNTEVILEGPLFRGRFKMATLNPQGFVVEFDDGSKLEVGVHIHDEIFIHWTPPPPSH